MFIHNTRSEKRTSKNILSSSMMAEHIDGNRLHIDLRYRFEYLSKFLNFTSEDITMLNTLAPKVFPLIPVIADTVYRKLFSFDITKQYFLIRNEGFEGFLCKKQCGITLESTQMELRRDMLSMYLKRVLTQYYMHINSLLGYVEHLLIDILYKTDTLDKKPRREMSMAINKFFWIQNDFFTMHYLMSLKDNSTANKNSEMNKTLKCCWI